LGRTEEFMKRYSGQVIAGAGGVCSALIVATLPHVYIENLIGLTGLSEIVPAAAPPLGNTARGLIAAAAGVVSAAVLFLFLSRKRKSEMGLAKMKMPLSDEKSVEIGSEKQSGKFADKLGGTLGKAKAALPKLSLPKFGKNSANADGKVTELSDLPKLRNADSHPDAPARKPIFAQSDLGSPLAKAVPPFEGEQPAAAEDDMGRAADIQQPRPAEAAPEPVAMEPQDIAQPEPSFSAANSAVTSAAASAEVPAPAAAAIHQPQSYASAASFSAPFEPSEEELNELSLSQLADRLESGLQRLRALETEKAAFVSASAAAQNTVAVPTSPAQDPAVSQPAPVSVQNPPEKAPPAQPSVEQAPPVDAATAKQAEMDAALKAALGTLERMTAQK